MKRHAIILTAIFAIAATAFAVGGAITQDGSLFMAHQDISCADGELCKATIDRTTSGDISWSFEVVHGTWTETLSSESFSGVGTGDLEGYWAVRARLK